MKSTLCFSLIFVLGITGFGYTAVIRVPQDQSTIQAGIDAAQDGDTVLVADGLYIGKGNVNIDFSGKAIAVKSKNGYGATIIHCENNNRGFIFQNGENESSMLSGFTIKGGKAGSGGAIYCKDSSPTIESNTITESEASDGGGIYCTNSSPNIINNVITDNSAYDGGGIYCRGDSSPTITRNEIANNVVQSKPIPMHSFGGGGIYCTDSSSPSITNNVITDNSAYRGGGIYCKDSSSPSIINNVIAYNEVSGTGGGIHCSSSEKPFVLNTIFWGNKNEQVWGSINIYYSNVQGGWDDIGNIDADPLFVAPENGNYHLQPDSPCINAGALNSPKDPDGTRADIGAFYYEHITPVPTKLEKISGDNHSGIVLSFLPNPLIVRVLDQNNNPMKDITIHFKASEGANVNPAQTTTDENGQAQTILTLGAKPGGYEITASVKSITPVVFTATATLDVVYQIELTFTKGINLISLPLRPNKAYTASTLAEELSATIIIRSHEGKFQVYVPEGGYGLDFPIEEAGKGYIINLLKETKFNLTGRAWGTQVKAAPTAPITDRWAFVVAGEISDKLPKDSSILASNHRTGQSVIANIGAAGKFTAVFVDMTKQRVVDVGDEISLQAVGSRGNTIGQAKQHRITSEQLANAYLLSTFSTVPTQTLLYQNYPNPFNPESWIPYELADPAEVTIRIYNVKGELVRTINLGSKNAGAYTNKSKAALWNGRTQTGEPTSSGIYFYQIKAGDFTATGKMILLQ